MDLEVFDDHPCELGEGPVWDERSGELIWLDILRQQVHRRGLGADAVRTTETLAEAPGCLALREDGGWVMALASGPALRSAGSEPEPITTYATIDGTPPASPVRGNDGAIDPVGRFWFGTIAWDMTPDVASLYRLDPGSDRPVRVVTEVSISNGLGWSPDGASMYYVDSGTGRIDVFDYEVATGTATGRRPFVTIPAATGTPDGLTVDAQGGVWVALWGGGAVHRYGPDGGHEQTIALPTPQVTSCAFVGDRLDRLAITTAAVELPDPAPLAGATFLADPAATGIPVPRFPG